MEYRIESASAGGREEFIAYCATHAAEHDESYVPDARWPLDGAEGADRPSFILRAGADGTVRGAAAGLFTASFRNARRLRFAVLHALADGLDAGELADRYRSLAGAVAGSVRGLADSAYLFMPEGLAETRSALESAGFRFERTAYLMGRDAEPGPEVPLPDGYTAEAVEPGDGAALAEFTAVRNRNFREVLGSTDALVEDIAAFMRSEEYLPGGLVLLRAPDGTACGTLRLERDDEEDSAFIGTVSVDRAHRGKGLATALIRRSLRMAAGAGFGSVFLSVNAENRNALSLYLREGFTVRKAMTCLTAALERLP